MMTAAKIALCQDSEEVEENVNLYKLAHLCTAAVPFQGEGREHDGSAGDF